MCAQPHAKLHSWCRIPKSSEAIVHGEHDSSQASTLAGAQEYPLGNLVSVELPTEDQRSVICLGRYQCQHQRWGDGPNLLQMASTEWGRIPHVNRFSLCYWSEKIMCKCKLLHLTDRMHYMQDASDCGHGQENRERNCGGSGGASWQYPWHAWESKEVTLITKEGALQPSRSNHNQQVECWYYRKIKHYKLSAERRRETWKIQPHIHLHVNRGTTHQ